MWQLGTGVGRFVFIAQWIALPVLYFFILFGRGFIGSPLGWYLLINLLASPLYIAMLLVVPIISVATSGMRSTRSVVRSAAWTSVIEWIALVGVGVFLVDGGDSAESVGSAFTVWTGASNDVSGLIFIGCWLVAIVTFVAGVVLASVGAYRNRPSKLHPTQTGASFA